MSSHGDAPRANLAHVVQFADIPAVRRLPSSGRAQDERFMAKALALAARGRGSTSPNPPVAAVVVRQHRIVGVGYHQRAGGPHAEVIALRQAGVHAAGGTLYVTLEPCCHLDKRTPPCAPLLSA